MSQDHDLPYRMAVLFAVASGLTSGVISVSEPSDATLAATILGAVATLSYLAWAGALRAERALSLARYALGIPLVATIAAWSFSSGGPAASSALALPLLAVGAFAPVSGVAAQGTIAVALLAALAFTGDDPSAWIAPAITTVAASVGGALLALSSPEPQEQRRSPLGRALFRALPIGVLLVQEGRIARANEAIGALVRREPEALVDLPFLGVIAPDDREEIEALVGSRVESSVEIRARRMDGTLFDATLTVASLDGGTRIVLLADRSDRARAERAKDEFVAVVSHELRTPLTSIRGALGLIEGGAAGEVSPKAHELVTIGKRNAERLIRLVNDILDLKKLESGRMRLKYQTLEPGPPVQAALDGLAVLAEDAGVELTAEIGDTEPIWGDPDRVIQVLTNLVSNAVKFAPEGSAVTLRVSGADEAVRFSVIDRGPGIPMDEKERIFSRFQQVDGSDARTKGGTGLGLAIAKAIVTAHGGTIGVETADGEGSTFFFELPVASRVRETDPPMA